VIIFVAPAKAVRDDGNATRGEQATVDREVLLLVDEVPALDSPAAPAIAVRTNERLR
jgi:hypothetical protein